MLKKMLAALLAFVAITAFAAIDANTATKAELESVKGIGPVISSLILSERNKGNFKDWNDMVVRVKGVGSGNAAKFSTGGLTVNGAAYAGAPAAVVKTKDAPASSKVAAAPARAATATKNGAEKAVDSTEHGVKRAASATESGVKRAASATERGLKRAASATATGVEKAASATKSGAGKVKDKVTGT